MEAGEVGGEEGVVSMAGQRTEWSWAEQGRGACDRVTSGGGRWGWWV